MVWVTWRSPNLNDWRASSVVLFLRSNGHRMPFSLWFHVSSITSFGQFNSDREWRSIFSPVNYDSNTHQLHALNIPVSVPQSRANIYIRFAWCPTSWHDVQHRLVVCLVDMVVRNHAWALSNEHRFNEICRSPRSDKILFTRSSRNNIFELNYVKMLNQVKSDRPVPPGSYSNGARPLSFFFVFVCRKNFW